MWIKIFQKIIYIYQTFGRAIIVLVVPIRCSCKFTPTCSEYCLEEMQSHGILIGGMYGLARVARCTFWVNGSPGRM